MNGYGLQALAMTCVVLRNVRKGSVILPRTGRKISVNECALKQAHAPGSANSSHIGYAVSHHRDAGDRPGHARRAVRRWKPGRSAGGRADTARGRCCSRQVGRLRRAGRHGRHGRSHLAERFARGGRGDAIARGRRASTRGGASTRSGAADTGTTGSSDRAVAPSFRGQPGRRLRLDRGPVARCNRCG